MQGENKNEIFKDFFNVSNIPTGVLGDTGIESAELVGGVVSTIKTILCDCCRCFGCDI